MQSVIQSPTVGRAGRAVRTPEQVAEFPGRFRRHVVMGSTVFEPGEQRRLYRIESPICHYVRTANGQHEVIEFAFPGDIIGLGRMPTHVSTARAMVETDVCVITDVDLDRALTNDSRLFFKLAEAIDCEFDYLKSRSLNADLLPPIRRLANFLLAIASINVSEGREALIVTDDVSSGYVAEQLQMSIDTLAMELMRLRQSGLLDVLDKGLRILDTAALETLAAGN
jgi:CRP/FNR family transcriptional regulator, anaerobic regulatory protein